MSTREIQQFIHQSGQFIFADGRQKMGMIVARYNIKEAKVEYYFIPAENEVAYRTAQAHHQLEAHSQFGNQVDVNGVLSATMLAAWTNAYESRLKKYLGVMFMIISGYGRWFFLYPYPSYFR